MLHMTRADIGSYLGLTLETVSRELSHLRAGKLIEVQTRLIRITDLAGLTCAARRSASNA
jgi:CRP/FNR family transcriptional regulator